MKKLLLVIAAVAMLLPSCKKINEALDSLDNRVSELENTTIPTINEQIDNINTSIADLEAADIELKNYITALQGTAAELQKSINDTNTKIDNVKTALQGEISTAKADVLAQLEALRTEMNNELTLINSTIATLQAKDTELEGKITELRTYVDTELKNTEDWATATFSTLEQYNALCTEVATIKTQIENLNKTISELETRLNTKIATDIAAAVKGLQGELAETVTEITNSYTSAISTAKEEITIAYTAAVQSSISTLETSMKQWVNEQLVNYYTIAESEAKLALLKADLEAQLAVQKIYCDSLTTALTNNMTSQVESLQKQIDAINKTIADINKDIESLYSKLEQTKTEITTAYTEAITKAIEENEGKWSDALAKEIQALNELIEKNNIAVFDAFAEEANSRLEALEADIAIIKNNISELQDDVAALLSRIQSVTYVPKYSDGKATMDYGSKVAEFDFLISPKSAVVDLSKVWNEALSVKAIYTQTRAVEFIDLPITEFAADAQSGVISLKVSGENLNDKFFQEQQDASAFLQISDGNSNIASDYVAMLTNYNIRFEDLQVKAICCKNWDANNDGGLSYAEAAAVDSIGAAFKENTNITAFTELKYFAGITAIPTSAFAGCSALRKIVIPDSVVSINSNAFKGCSYLSQIILSKNIENVASSSFAGCASLPIIDNIRYADTCVVGPIEDSIGDCVIRSGARIIASEAFKYCSSLTSVIIPDSVVAIGDSAFYCCDSLTNVIIGTGISRIGRETFIGTTGAKACNLYLKSVTPPSIYYNYNSTGSFYVGTFHWTYHIYVPRSSYEVYKQYSSYKNGCYKENWSQYNVYPYDFE